ncbi:MAG: hypothetical protein ACR2MK_01060 [Solirubrobacteraceae bacterium]
MSGRWLGPPHTTGAEDELLVVQVEGRRHRFASRHDDERRAELEPGRWTASFTVPAWAEPRRDGQAALWLGDAVVPVPPLHGSHQGAPQAEVAPAPPGATAGITELPGPLADTPRSGPLADLLLKETIAALHSELEQRTADAARMRGALADSQSELDARTAAQAELEATLGELRGELERLTEAVQDRRRELDERADQVAGLRQELASAQVSREAAISEAAGLRAELERLGSELAVTRERISGESGGLGDANRLLADARALGEQLRDQR